ncbi:DNA polymerase iota [Aplochiton taeniatus]
MIRNPALRNVPLGIQQKNIIVTCNYVAREQGVTKLMFVTDAMEKCPQLVLVKGEDLTHYREMSYKLTELLMTYCPLVERLGFDENFMDITEVVEKRLRDNPESGEYSFTGHVYNNASINVKAIDHPRLAIGSHVAAELREVIYSKLGLTGCAGISTSKLLAKLVSGTFKPNQQTTLLPLSVKDIMGSLNGLQKIPGVGHQTAKRFQALGLVSVRDLQLFPLADLVREFGDNSAQRLRNLALGIDDTPVTPTGAPQSLSDEDSFKKMSSTKEVLQKVEDLLQSLLDRMQKDGRQPRTFRLTIRRYSATNKWFNRESKQCPIPNHIGQKITSGSSDALAQLMTIAMKLFHKVVDCYAAFHLTLINVCFSNLQTSSATSSSKGSITSFFAHVTSHSRMSQCQDDRSQSTVGRFVQEADLMRKTETSVKTNNWSNELLSEKGPVASSQSESVTGSTVGLGTKKKPNSPECQLPLNADPEVFRLLPVYIQNELLSPTCTHTSQTPLNHSPKSFTAATSPLKNGLCKVNNSHHITLDNMDVLKYSGPSDKQTAINHRPSLDQQMFPEGASPGEEKSLNHVSSERSSKSKFPLDIDPMVFSELPPEIQRELLSEWRQQKPVLKIPFSKKQGKSQAKEKKGLPKSTQANNLLKYFKSS